MIIDLICLWNDCATYLMVRKTIFMPDDGRNAATVPLKYVQKDEGVVG